MTTDRETHQQLERIKKKKKKRKNKFKKVPALVWISVCTKAGERNYASVAVRALPPRGTFMTGFRLCENKNAPLPNKPLLLTVKVFIREMWDAMWCHATFFFLECDKREEVVCRFSCCTSAPASEIKGLSACATYSGYQRRKSYLE